MYTKQKLILFSAICILSGCNAKNKNQKVIRNYTISIPIKHKYLIVPIEEKNPELNFSFKNGEKPILTDMNIRVATNKTDYTVPIDIHEFVGKTLQLKIASADSEEIEAVKAIQQADNFDFDYNEKFRPDYHFSPYHGWTNDPNGMVYYNGYYHLFYQHNPYGSVWGNMHWGHAISKDLVTWQHLPDAICPDSLGTIFSGSAVIDKDNTAGFGKNAMVAIYACAGKHQTECIAYSNDEGKSFTKYAHNPVVSDKTKPDFRDPKVFWYAPEKKWIMALATGQTISFYTSPNLKEWTKSSEFGQNIGSHGGVWECPDLFPLSYKPEFD